MNEDMKKSDEKIFVLVKETGSYEEFYREVLCYSEDSKAINDLMKKLQDENDSICRNRLINLIEYWKVVENDEKLLFGSHGGGEARSSIKHCEYCLENNMFEELDDHIKYVIEEIKEIEIWKHDESEKEKENE